MTKEKSYTIQVAGFEAKGEVGKIEPPIHKFEVGEAKAPMTKVLASWLIVIRNQGEVVPVGGADRFLVWFADLKPVVPFVEIDSVDKNGIKYWNVNDKGERSGSIAKSYDRNQINIQIKRLCGLN